MPKDYKHRVPGYRHPQRRRGRGRIIAGIAVLCLAAGAGAYVVLLGVPGVAVTGHNAEADPGKQPGDQETVGGLAGAEHGGGKEKTNEPGTKTAAPTSKPSQPRFTFYKILSEKEEIIPEAEIRTIKREEQRGKQPPGGGYMIQAGSFRARADAEKLRSDLDRLKVKARLESVKIENVEWFRVKIGAYDTLADADRLRTFLRKNGIDSVVQKANPPSSRPVPKH